MSPYCRRSIRLGLSLRKPSLGFCRLKVLHSGAIVPGFIATSAAGTDFSDLALFAPYSAYFITAAQYGPEASVPDGTLFINVLSYTEAPVL
jgi:hypothetical protein